MQVIYEPRGRAREYAELACNLFDGCIHGCRYCYAPACRFTDPTAYHAGYRVRAKILPKLERDLGAMMQAGDEREILFCFTSDPFQDEAAAEVTGATLRLVAKYGRKATVLTKGGSRAAPEFPVMSAAGIRFGQTLCWTDDRDRATWEPAAAPVEDRIAALYAAKAAGLSTWISLEPVIDVGQCLVLIDRLADAVDYWKVGKINHSPAEEAAVDWADAVARFDAALSGRHHYIKKDLAAFRAAPA